MELGAEEAERLPHDSLVIDGEGELRRVKKYRPMHPESPTETWLEHWSDEYGQVVGNKHYDIPYPLTPVKIVPMTEEEIKEIQE